MIPDFDDNGYLPQGVHKATFEEVRNRFGLEPEVRQAQTESLGWLIDIAKRAGIARLVIDGSYETDKWEPNDIDCVLLAGLDFPKDSSAEIELNDGLPFVQLAVVDQALFDRYVEVIYGTDRMGTPKGVVEVIL